MKPTFIVIMSKYIIMRLSDTDVTYYYEIKKYSLEAAHSPRLANNNMPFFLNGVFGTVPTPSCISHEEAPCAGSTIWLKVEPTPSVRSQPTTIRKQ